MHQVDKKIKKTTKAVRTCHPLKWNMRLSIKFHSKNMVFLTLTFLMHWMSMGCKLSNFSSINNFWGFLTMLAQRQRAKQQIFKLSRWKRLTQVEIENRVFLYMFNSKGDNLGQREFKLSLKQFGGVLWWNNGVVLQTSAQDFCAVQNVICQVQSEVWWKILIFS